MNFYTKQHKFYCGIDLHTKKMFVCILDAEHPDSPKHQYRPGSLSSPLLSGFFFNTFNP